MHVSDALISPPVAITTGIMATVLIGIASRKLKTSTHTDIVPLMGVMGAFVFAAQMINFSIPGTGSSGHLIGGILLSAIMGPWAAFITLCSIIIVQCLIFADGGILALGCNIINMAVTTCLIGYPLIYRPIVGKGLKPARIACAAIISSIVSLEIGAFAVTAETEFSHVTSLPFATFIKFMLPIHCAIGFIEGIVTASLLLFIARYAPDIFNHNHATDYPAPKLNKRVLLGFGVLTLLFAGGFSVLASEFPDGLEWSIAKVAGLTDFSSEPPATAIMPDYDSGFAGIIGAVIVMTLLWGITNIIFFRKRKSLK